MMGTKLVSKELKHIRLMVRLIYLLGAITVVFLSMALVLCSNRPGFKANLNAENQWKLKTLEIDIPAGKKGEEIRYGHQLITQTDKLIGPLSEKATRRYSGNGLTCNNCHLDAGRKIGAASFVGVTNRFPQFLGRENRNITIEERINGCMQRSMNGKMLPEYSAEMRAIVSYMKWLSEDVPRDIELLYEGFVNVILPDFKADSSLGKKLYQSKCINCHAKNGEGKSHTGSGLLGYRYPPLAGNDSFNDGAGMYRVITATRFIKGNMPLGATYDDPLVTDEEAYHIAGYLASLSRPEKPEKEKDYPDRKLKPVSTPYGPWKDDFPEDQHKYGPFLPIMAYYDAQFDIVKSK
jgi:thiosulfate dehydrogenase